MPTLEQRQSEETEPETKKDRLALLSHRLLLALLLPKGCMREIHHIQKQPFEVCFLKNNWGIELYEAPIGNNDKGDGAINGIPTSRASTRPSGILVPTVWTTCGSCMHPHEKLSRVS